MLVIDILRLGANPNTNLKGIYMKKRDWKKQAFVLLLELTTNANFEETCDHYKLTEKEINELFEFYHNEYLK
jgi:hypothetical protein